MAAQSISVFLMSRVVAMSIRAAGQLDATRTNQRERFDWLAGRLERWDGYYELAELEEFLHGEGRLPGQREKALVLLALSDQKRAGRILETFDPSGESASFRYLYQIALLHTRETAGRSDAPARASG